MMWRLVISPIVVSVALLLAACSSQPQVEYVSPGAVDTTSIEFSSTDLQTTAQTMVEQMLTSPRVIAMTKHALHSGGQGKLPVVMLAGIQNNTDQHIDTRAIENAVSTRLINSDLFNFTGAGQEAAIKQQLDFQHHSGLVDPATAAKIGQQVGAQYMLYGSISSINQRNTDQQSVYFQVTMKLLNIQSGLLVWQGEKQIRKVAKRRTFGW